MRHLIAAAFLMVLSVFALYAQNADNRTSPEKPEESQPKSVREMLKKMQIEQSKKEYDEMLDRGQQALKISEELERSFAQRSTLTPAEVEKLDEMERLVKKIRSELGGKDGDEPDDRLSDDPDPNSVADGFKALQKFTGKLVDELKKTTRFSISAAAIQSSNAVLKVVRFLRLKK